MSHAPSADEESARVAAEAHAWFARMKADDGWRDRDAFERWRDVSPAHRAAYARLEAQWRTIGAAGPAAMDWRRSRPRTLALVAAAVALLVIGGALLAGVGFSTATVAATRVGEIAETRLSDGSSMTLDTASRVAVRLGRTTREAVLETGRARFDIAADPARPFRVRAGALTITAQRTLFDVRLTVDGAQVTQLRGRVDVDRGTADPARATLAAGEQLGAAGGRIERLDGAGLARASAWRAGRLVFDGVPLGEVVAEANRYLARPVELADDVRELEVTGTFRTGRREPLVQALAAGLGLAVVRGPGDALTLARKADRPN